MNFFGGAFRERDVIALLDIEKDPDPHFIILSDVWLDRSEVRASPREAIFVQRVIKTALVSPHQVHQKLRQLFEGYRKEIDPPLAFIFMGNFCSQPYGRDYLATMKEGFAKLANLLLEFNSIFYKT